MNNSVGGEIPLATKFFPLPNFNFNFVALSISGSFGETKNTLESGVLFLLLSFTAGTDTE